MNIFTVLFWAVWFIYAAFLFQQLKEARRRKKEEISCAWCKHYQGCQELHTLIDEGISIPCACSDFERREGGKLHRKWPHKRGEKLREKGACSHCIHYGETSCEDLTFSSVEGHSPVFLCRNFEQK